MGILFYLATIKLFLFILSNNELAKELIPLIFLNGSQDELVAIRKKNTKPKIRFNNSSTDLSKLNLNISIKSLLNNDFALQNGSIGLIKTEIKQLIEVANQIKPTPFLFLARGMFNKGYIDGEIAYYFDEKYQIFKCKKCTAKSKSK